MWGEAAWILAASDAQAAGDIDDGLVPLPEPWERVRQQALAITSEQRAQSITDPGPVPSALRRYIHALCNPEKTTIVCNGGAGTGKTFTASLVAMLMLAQGSATRLQHTKPLVSAGGASVGFERGSMNDKLAFWTRPTADAAKRVATMCGIDQGVLDDCVESFPIDRIRGISVPMGE